MKKTKNDIFWILLAMTLSFMYPMTSFRWYKHCKKNSDDANAKKFLLFGAIGIVGIFSIIMLWFVESVLFRMCFIFPGCILYVIAANEQAKLICRKVDEERKDKTITRESVKAFIKRNDRPIKEFLSDILVYAGLILCTINISLFHHYITGTVISLVLVVYIVIKR